MSYLAVRSLPLCSARTRTLNTTPLLLYDPGHLLCVSCVQRLDPPRCALCRELFRPGHARKIHVEVTQKPRSSSMREIAVDVRRLERRLADAVLDGTQADVLSVFKEVQDWVNTHSDRPPDDVRSLPRLYRARGLL